MIKQIILLSLFLRLVLIDQSLWLDEAVTVKVSTLTLNDIFTRFLPGDFHPPLYYLFIKFWSLILGNSEFTLRLPSLIFGVMSVYFVFKLSKIVFPKQPSVAEISALILATNPLHIYYSQEVRMYSAATLISILLVYFSILSKDHPRKYLPIISLLVALGAFTYYPILFLLPVLFFIFHSQKQTIQFICAIIPVALLLVLWKPLLLVQLQNGFFVKHSLPLWWQILGKTNLKSLILLWTKFLIGRISFLTTRGYISYIFVVSVIPVFAFFRSFSVRHKSHAIWIWLLAPSFLLALFGVFGSGFSYFRLLFVFPAFTLLLAQGIAQLSPQWKKFALFVLLASQLTSLFIFWINPRFHRENWKDAVAYIEANTPVNFGAAAVFVNPGQTDPYIYYSKKFPAFSSQDWSSQNLNHIWLFRYAQPIFDPQDTLVADIEAKGFVKVREKDFNQITIWEYKKN